MILEQLKHLYDTRHDEIEAWLSATRAKGSPYLTTSVDLRHSGHRLVPVDTNLYPAGFNNLSPNATLRAVKQLKGYVQEHYPDAKSLLIIPESHTRNTAYLENLAILQTLFTQSGLEVRIGHLTTEEVLTLESVSGKQVIEEPIMQEHGRLKTKSGFNPDIIVLNNDFTGGPSPLLSNIAQPVIPPMHMGWYQRRKTLHFAAYQQLAEEFARHFALDPWVLSAYFHACGQVNFKERQGVDCLAKSVDMLIEKAKLKHAEYGITQDPYVYVKADSGTYGMGIMSVRDGSELLEMNKKDRNKMHVIKEGAHVSEVILQEGIPTVDQVKGSPAEPMIYLIDGVPVGGMYRVNAARDAYHNLNAAGMEFTGMCDELEATFDCRQPVRDCHFAAYGLVAVLASLAAGREVYLMYDSERKIANV